MILNRIVENVDGIDVDVWAYIVASVRNPNSKLLIYEVASEKIDEFIDIYGLKDIKDWEIKLYNKITNKKQNRIKHATP